MLRDNQKAMLTQDAALPPRREGGAGRSHLTPEKNRRSPELCRRWRHHC